MSFKFPTWLPQALAIKIGIYSAIALTLFLAWRAREAKIAEQYYVKGITEGENRLEGKYKEQWNLAIKQLEDKQKQDEANYTVIVKGLAAIVGRTDTIISDMKHLSTIALTIEEKQRNYVEAHNVPPDQLDLALRDLSNEIKRILDSGGATSTQIPSP